MPGTAAYSAHGVEEQGRLVDIRLEVGAKTWHLLGRGGEKTETRPAEAVGNDNDVLPVFIGAGFGAGVELLAATGRPVAIVDAEAAITGLTNADRFADLPNVLWIDSRDPQAIMTELSRWQMANGGKPFKAVVHGLYLRLDPDLYRNVRDALQASSSVNFWEKAKYPKFQSWPPRMLLVTSQYFLMGEIKAACERLDIPHRYLEFDTREQGCSEFVEEMLTAIVEFKPDFVFTVNHLGVDREGILVDLLERLELPLASWFVDNPHLILYMYNRLVSPWTGIFTWDSDNISSLAAMGFEHISYLALAADTKRFIPDAPGFADQNWASNVSFVGNSMLYKIRPRLESADPPPKLVELYPQIAQAFGNSNERSVRSFMEKHFPEAVAYFEKLGSPERKLSYETLVTWESTRAYRRSCVEQTLDYYPLIVGDPGWKETFEGEGDTWRWHKELNYYNDLPLFYPRSKINFNCTSLQMKGAINQRVFDVPACGAFLLTDYRQQMEELFEPGTEVAFYRDVDEISDLVARYLRDEAARKAIAEAGRKRVLAHHTYEQRLTQMLETMQRWYGSA